MKHPLGRRARAARVLAGYDSLGDFAAALDYPRLSAGTLRVIERGERDLAPHERERYAEVCGISIAFFDIDFAQLGTLAGAGAEFEELRPYIEEELRHVVEEVNADVRAKVDQLAAAVAELAGVDDLADIAGRPVVDADVATSPRDPRSEMASELADAAREHDRQTPASDEAADARRRGGRAR